MEFEREVRFLGMEENQMKDGGVYYAVSLFDADSGPVTVNVTDRCDALPALQGAKFGDAFYATFRLVPRDKLYKLGLRSVTVA